MECSVCRKTNACMECCNVRICLLDFLCSMHSNHFEKAKIVDKEQFNKDLDYCKAMKEKCEDSINKEIEEIEKSEETIKSASKRVIPEISHSWDLSKRVKTISDHPVDTKTVSPIPRITFSESDTLPIMITKVLTRSLRYRYQNLPEEMKRQIIDFYREDSFAYEGYQDSSLVDMQIGGIVMQMVNLIMRKGEHGELGIADLDMKGEDGEIDKKKGIKSYLRSLDFNILNCDDLTIIQKILMREVFDITQVDFSKYFSHVKSQKSEVYIMGDNRREIELICSECNNPHMLYRVIKEYTPVCTHDEIWVNKDAIDFLAEYSCPKCGHSFMSEQLLGN